MTRARDVATQGGLVLLNTTDFSAVASASIDDVFSATYANYLVECNYTNSSAGANMNLRVAVGGTPLTTSGYAAVTQRNRSDGGAVIYTTSTSSVLIGAGSNFSNAGGFNATIFNPFATEVTFLNGFHSFKETTSLNYTGIFSGQTQNTTSYDGLLFFPSVGNVTGTIKIYGYK